MEISALRTKATELRKTKRFEDALPIYESLWNQSNQNDGWDGWGLAYCLYKVKRTAEALDICRTLYKIDADQEVWLQLYAQCIFKLEIDKETVENINRFLKAASGILELVPQNNPYAPYSRTVFKVCKQLKQRGNFGDILQWLNRLDKTILSDEQYEFMNEKGRKQRSPSDLQQYYTYRCGALYKTARYEECQASANEGLNALKTTVNDGEFWLTRYHAKASAALGDTADAYLALTALSQRKQTWFLYAELADLARKLDKKDEAWRFMLLCMTDTAPADLKVNVFSQAADLLSEDGRENKAREHMQLALSIRQEKAWPIKGTLLSSAQALGVSSENIPSSYKIGKSLRAWWQEQLDQMEPQKKGKVANLIGSGNAGFIQSEDNESYFFKQRNVQGKALKPGEAVTFKTMPGFDKKKNRPSVDATQIQRIG